PHSKSLGCPLVAPKPTNHKRCNARQQNNPSLVSTRRIFYILRKTCDNKDVDPTVPVTCCGGVTQTPAHPTTEQRFDNKRWRTRNKKTPRRQRAPADRWCSC
ncbi:unnamed protein product, partial [Ectocarpus sp. 8 AP-2014]